MRLPHGIIGLALVWSALAVKGFAQPARTPPTIDFNRDIRPILSDACFHCHGPDRSKRKGDLHLDAAEGAFADRGGYAAITPGKPDESELIKRITHLEAAKRMPPAKSGPALAPDKIALLRQWIAQGAEYKKHWSLIPPKRNPLPDTKDKAWCRNPIDRFVLARLEQEGLTPALEADRVALLRRVSLDLTGLPPTTAEVDAFLADKSTDAYEKVVDRLLASPRYGERMAKPWLDAARYADTNGYQTDGDRTMWRWRDWVIEAFNANMPFDQFTIEQLAGDMLPKATLEQKIATGFNRNHRGNSEGGVIPEEYAVEYVVDRVDTTATVWLGLTAGCGKCHNHKYDPLSQKEFYQLFAYFNNVPERGKAIKYGNSPPFIKAPTREQQAQLKEMQARLDQARRQVAYLEPELRTAQAAWESQRPMVAADWTITEGLERPAEQADVAYHENGHLELRDAGKFGFFDKFTLSTRINPRNGQGGTILSRMQNEETAEGYSVVLARGKLHVNLIKRWLDDAIRVESENAIIVPNRWQHVTVTYDGSRLAEGVKVYVNGEPVKMKVHLDDLNQSFATDAPFRIGRGGTNASLFQGRIEGLSIYRRCLHPDEVSIISVRAPISEIVAAAARSRSRQEQLKLRGYYLDQLAPQPIRLAHQELHDLESAWVKLDESIPTTMVMEEMPAPRDTHILLRGEYDKKGPKVTPGIPAIFVDEASLLRLPARRSKDASSTGATTKRAASPTKAPTNRLGFAHWLVERNNPLTARVTVNRFWQMLFGTGIVKTVEDFGVQGEWPSHPELLDWLAVEFMDPIWGVGENCCGQGSWDGVRAWDVKHILKVIVTSATYRQTSKAMKELMQRDPDNRLLARGPRVRLSAEMVRDQALFVSGLLVEKLGGPSVKPYQPPGLAKELHGTDDYAQDHGRDLYRRSLYTYWKRTVAPPMLMTFDGANRETCIVRETRTNTPLQALNLMNDVTFVEAARMLAQRVLLASGGRQPAGAVSHRHNLAHMFRLATSRQPSPRELDVLSAGLDRHLTHYRFDRAAALKLVKAGEHPRDPSLDVADVAAYTAMANVILNLDEVITKE